MDENISGSISGALDPNGREALEQVENVYENIGG